MNTNQPLLYGMAGLIIGGLLVGGAMIAMASAGNSSMLHMMGMSENTMMNHHNMSESDMTMDDMVKELEGKTGDEFDEAFITGMIEHHEGAVAMAEAAKTQAKHEEIKSMADEIISAQTSEIEQMREWMKDWGYTSKPTDMMRD